MNKRTITLQNNNIHFQKLNDVKKLMMYGQASLENVEKIFSDSSGYERDEYINLFSNHKFAKGYEYQSMIKTFNGIKINKPKFEIYPDKLDYLIKRSFRRFILEKVFWYSLLFIIIFTNFFILTRISGYKKEMNETNNVVGFVDSKRFVPEYDDDWCDADGSCWSETIPEKYIVNINYKNNRIGINDKQLFNNVTEKHKCELRLLTEHYVILKDSIHYKVFKPKKEILIDEYVKEISCNGIKIKTDWKLY